MASDLDQYYTNETVAKKYIKIVETMFPHIDLFIEPSAGTGAFSKHIKNVLSFDIEPKHKNILERNFLEVMPFEFDITTRQTCIIGNPPFGKNASLAIKFFNHSTKFADTISFILPKSFRKESIQNRLHSKYWLIYDEDVPNDAFIFEHETYDVPCCFQIWIRRVETREKFAIIDNPYLVYTTKDNAEFSIRRVGVNAGKADINVNKSISSHYFVKRKKNSYSVKKWVKMINDIDFSVLSNSSTGPRSLSKSELAKLLIEKILI
jgi:hypothetical protein